MNGSASAGTFNTDLLMYYLAGVGGALGGKGSWQESLGSMSQQQMQSQNYMKMMQQMLGGLPAGAKMSGDKDNLTVKMPTGSLVGGKDGGAENSFPARVSPSEGGTGIDWTKDANLPPVARNRLMAEGLLNPTASPLDISSSNLVGLTPEHIASGLQIKLKGEEIETLKAYREALGAKALGGSSLDKPFPIQVPGVGAVTTREWSALPKEDREYAAYVHELAENGETPLSREKWRRETHPNNRTMYLEDLMKRPELLSIAKDLAKAGATTIGDFTERKQTEKEVANEEYFTSPKLSEDVEKHLGTPVNRVRWSGSETPDKEKAKMTADYVRQKIVSSGGKVQGVKLEGRNMVWSVKWKSGRTGEVRYAF